MNRLTWSSRYRAPSEPGSAKDFRKPRTSPSVMLDASVDSWAVRPSVPDEGGEPYPSPEAAPDERSAEAHVIRWGSAGASPSARLSDMERPPVLSSAPSPSS